MEEGGEWREGERETERDRWMRGVCPRFRTEKFKFQIHTGSSL